MRVLYPWEYHCYFLEENKTVLYLSVHISWCLKVLLYTIEKKTSRGEKDTIYKNTKAKIRYKDIDTKAFQVNVNGNYKKDQYKTIKIIPKCISKPEKKKTGMLSIYERFLTVFVYAMYEDLWNITCNKESSFMRHSCIPLYIS